ncbi:DUF4352 domain-containing protein [Pedobacter sp.]|nr:DUF4352 domain-containing protein [Candidatus Saccharibacteria bacterium]
MKKLHFKRKKPIDERINQEVKKELREAKREWRHFVKFKDENHLLFTAFVIVIATALVINTIYIIDQSGPNRTTAVQTAPTASEKVLTSLQTGENDAMTVTVSHVTENSDKDKAFTIDPKETMLILTIAITNNTDSIQSLIPVNQFFVRTNEGDTIALHVSSFVTSPLAATELVSGETVTGQLSFNVPKHISSPLLYIDTGWGKNVPLVFDVLH